MATILFDKIVFGPVFSRRLGVSLGVNLLPQDRKICNFDCIYCECGLTFNKEDDEKGMPTREQVKNALYQTLEDMAANDNDPDVITFAGNGEPTLHPEFSEIIDDTIEVKNIFFPDAEIAVLTNSTTIHLPGIQDALAKVDKAILKLDSAFDNTIELHNRPKKKLSAGELINTLSMLEFDVIIQTMFITGESDGKIIDNTTEKEIEAWLDALLRIMPAEVQIYTISRDTPDEHDIKKVPPEVLNAIADRVKQIGLNTQVSA